MIDKEEIKKYIRLYRDILNKHQILVDDRDLKKIYHLILLTFQLDDLYDSARNSPNPSEIETIKKAMISLMPEGHPIALNGIELLFKSMNDEANLDLSKSLTQYLRVCGKSIGGQLIVGYLASKKNIDLNVWFSPLMIKFNDGVNDLIRLANDYLDITVDSKRISQEVSQVKAINFFHYKFIFKGYLYYRYIAHKISYYFYLIRFKYLTISSQGRDYLDALNCAESVLDLAVKAYILDRESGRKSEA
jgi:hypothetical protein